MSPPEKKPHSQPWSDIPLELAGLVLRLLPAYADRARFAAVCPQWRAAARQLLPPSLPLLALPGGTFYSLPYSEPFRFPGCDFAGFESASGRWLVFERGDGCFLVDPFSSEKVTLPSVLSVRLRPPNAFPEWSYKWGTRFPYPYRTWMHMGESEKLRIRKLIMCSANLVAALVGIQRVQILMCQPGALAWSVLANDELKWYEDMAFYKGKLYVITGDENLLVVNIMQDQSTGDPQVSEIGRVIKDKGDPSCYETVVVKDNFRPHKKLYLVELCGNLLMVRRTIWLRDTDLGVRPGCVVGLSKFEVFEANFEHSRWVKVPSLGGDHVLFLGRSCSRAVPVSQYRLLGDRIFFLDEYAEENSGEYRFDVADTSCDTYDMILVRSLPLIQ